MDTPICDFVKKYAEKNSVRAHMPGHKAKGFLGVEHLDITEFDGADNLFSPTGIIKKSMDNASEIFGADTFYSTEGSSLSIKAMLYLVYTYAKNKEAKVLVDIGNSLGPDHRLYSCRSSCDSKFRFWLCPKRKRGGSCPSPAGHHHGRKLARQQGE